MTEVEIDLTAGSQDLDSSLVITNSSPPQRSQFRFIGSNQSQRAEQRQSNSSAQRRPRHRKKRRRIREQCDADWIPPAVTWSDMAQRRSSPVRRSRGRGRGRSAGATVDSSSAAPVAAGLGQRQGGRQAASPTGRAAMPAADPYFGVDLGLQRHIRRGAQFISSLVDGTMGRPFGGFLSGPLAGLAARNGNFGPDDYERLLALDQGIVRQSGLSQSLLDQLTVYPHIAPPAPQTTSTLASTSASASAAASATSEARDMDSSPPAAAGVAPECPVCLEAFQHHEVLCVLPCCHKYHHDCIMPWLKSNTACPVCKHDVADMLTRSHAQAARVPAAPAPAAAAALGFDAASSAAAYTSSGGVASAGASGASTSASAASGSAGWLPGMPLSNEGNPGSHDDVIELLSDDSDDGDEEAAGGGAARPQAGHAPCSLSSASAGSPVDSQGLEDTEDEENEQWLRAFLGASASKRARGL